MKLVYKNEPCLLHFNILISFIEWHDSGDVLLAFTDLFYRYATSEGNT